MEEQKRCGTCKWFGGKKPRAYRQYACHYGPLPRWVIDLFMSSDRYQHQYCGKDCETWEARQ